MAEEPMATLADRDQFWSTSPDPIVSAYGPAPSAPLSMVEWRIQGKHFQGPSGGPTAVFVAYLDARDMADLLDQWVGSLNWRADYEAASVAGKAGLWGILSIRHPSRPDEWVTKRDVGVPSDIEALKGLVSDAFKRVGCVQWGCGRNVYSLPQIKAPVRLSTAGKAFATPESLKVILSALKAQGIDATGSRVAGGDDEPNDGTGSPNPAKAATRKAASAPAKKAPAGPKPPAATAPAATAPAAPTGDLAEEQAELTAALAALEDGRAQADAWIRQRGVDPETWTGLTAGKVRSIRSALKNMGTVAAHGNPPLSKPPEPPAPPSTPEEKSPRADLAERAEALPVAWGTILADEIKANVEGLRGSVGELVMQVPDDPDWDAWLYEWVTDAETALAEDPEAVPPGGETF